MELFHVSLEPVSDGIFVPRVPRNVASMEDTVTPRICFSESIIGCLAAIADFDNKISCTDFDYKNSCYNAYIYSINTEDFSPEDFIPWNELYESNKVPDASITHEWWLLKPVKLNPEPIQIHDYVIDELYWLTKGNTCNYLKQLSELETWGKYINWVQRNKPDSLQVLPCYLINFYSDFVVGYYEWVKDNGLQTEDTFEELQVLASRGLLTISLTCVCAEYTFRHRPYKQMLLPGSKDYMEYSKPSFFTNLNIF